MERNSNRTLSYCQSERFWPLGIKMKNNDKQEGMVAAEKRPGQQRPKSNVSCFYFALQAQLSVEPLTDLQLFQWPSRNRWDSVIPDYRSLSVTRSY